MNKFIVVALGGAAVTLAGYVFREQLSTKVAELITKIDEASEKNRLFYEDPSSDD